MDLIKYVDSVMKLAARLKLDDIELLISSYRGLDARIENKEVTLELNEDIFAAGVRAIKAGRICHVPVTDPSVDLLAGGLRTALAKAGPAPFDAFAVTDSAPAGPKSYDAAVAKFVDAPARLRDLAQEMLRQAWATGKVETFEGGTSVAVEQRVVATMHSRKPVYAERTMFGASVEVNSKDFDYVVGRQLPDLGPVGGLGAALARSIPSGQTTPEAEDMKGRSVPALIHPVLLEQMLRRLVAEHIYASTVQDGTSRYRVGDKVASDIVTIWDDATAPFGWGTFPTDDEGTPARKNLIVDKGVLKTLLYDRASAKKDGVESTGNGRRRPVLIEEEHEAPVRCTMNDIYVQPGVKPLADMVAGIGRGLLVKVLLGFHTSNRTTGDFANTLYMGRIIRDGSVVALPEAGRWQVKGNALDCLKAVSAVSRETLSVGPAVLPWVQVELMVG